MLLLLCPAETRQIARLNTNTVNRTNRYNLAMDDTVKPAILRFGDHLKVKRRLYSHHGIYIGNNHVIHYAPPPGKSVGDGISWRQLLGADSVINTIHIAKLDDFEYEGIRASIVPYEKPRHYPPLKTVARAESRIGENGYNLWGNNCEQFTRWCKQVQPEGKPVNLWESTWEGALLGLSTGARARQWSTMAVGAGLGALLGVTRKWLQTRTLPRADAEFASFSSALYFGLTEKYGPHPFGRSFQHASQIPHPPKTIDTELPEGVGDEIVFVYRGGFFKRTTRKDWLVTERAIYHIAHNHAIDFHDVMGISARAGRLLITTLDGKHHYLSCHYIKAKQLADFLTSAIAGTVYELRESAKTMSGRIKDAIIGSDESA